MRKILLTSILLAIVAFPAMAQEEIQIQEISEDEDTVFQKREVIIIDEADDSSGSDLSTYSLNIRKPKVRANISKRHSFKFGGIGLGYNGLVGDMGSLKIPEDADYMSLRAKSINFNLQFFTYHYNFCNHLSFRTGFELEVNNFRFDKNMTLTTNEDGITVPDFSYAERGIELQKSKLVTGYINIPMVLKVNFGKNKEKAYVYGGVVGGWRWFTYQKVKADSEALNGKHRYHDDYNLRNLHWGYTAGVGFNRYGIYATYYPNSIFKPGKGPDVRQVNIGISLTY